MLFVSKLDFRALLSRATAVD